MRRSITALVSAALVAGGVGAAVAAPAQTAARGARPAAEHVPAAVDFVRIAYRDTQDASQNRTINLHGQRADEMIDLFNALKREPKDTAHCLAFGTASTRVVFRGTNHKWVATEAICTNLTVTRDGKSLPTLIESKAWNDALTHYLGHSPTGSGDNSPR